MAAVQSLVRLFDVLSPLYSVHDDARVVNGHCALTKVAAEFVAASLV